MVRRPEVAWVLWFGVFEALSLASRAPSSPSPPLAVLERCLADLLTRPVPTPTDAMRLVVLPGRYRLFGAILPELRPHANAVGAVLPSPGGRAVRLPERFRADLAPESVGRRVSV